MEIISDNVFGRRSWSANMTSSAFQFSCWKCGDESFFDSRCKSRPSSVTLKMWIDRRIGGEINTWRKDGRWAADSQQICSGKLRWQLKITHFSIGNTSSKGTFSIAMLKHTRRYVFCFGLAKSTMMAGHVRCTLAWTLANCGWWQDHADKVSQKHPTVQQVVMVKSYLPGGFKHFLFSPLFGKDFPFD